MFTNSDNPPKAVLTFFMGILFIVSGTLILRKSLSQINVSFACAMFILAISVFIASLGYINTNYQIFWPYATALFIIAPLGFYLSAKMFIHPVLHWQDNEILFVFGLNIFLALSSIAIYPLADTSLNTMFGDIALTLFLLLIVSEFNKIRYISQDPHTTKMLNYLLLGFIVSMFGLVSNLTIVLITNSGTILRLVFPVIGILFVTVPFAKIIQPNLQIIRKSKGFTLNVDQFMHKYEFVLKNLELYFNSAKLLQAPILQDKNSLSSEKTLSEIKLGTLQGIHSLSFLLLMEAAFNYPQPIKNAKMQQTFNKRKSTISDHINKLIDYGYFEPKLDLQDIRSKPVVITKKGAQFIFQLHKELNMHISKGKIQDLLITNLK